MSLRILKYTLLSGALLTILAFLVACDSPSDDNSRGDAAKREIVKGEIGAKLDTYLTRITPFGFSGALLVAKDGEVILNKGYGLAIRSDNVANTQDTVFSTGSITKQFTAAGIMKLEMMGKLNTGDLISKYFDDVPEDKKNVTLHHLLTHTSGVLDGVGDDFEKALRDETVQKVLDEPLQFEPGEDFSYSNAGYSLLAAIIEKVSGQAYEEFMNENIFKPAGMEFTGYRMPEWEKKVVAHWYSGEKDNGTPLEKPYPYWNFIGNGGILSTTMDMYRWHLALLGNDVLSDEAKKKMFTPFFYDYGYGWDVLEREMGLLIQHDGGSSLGCSAEMRRYIDAGVVTMLFCNRSYGNDVLFEPIRDKIETLVFGGDVLFPPPVTFMDPEKEDTYEGTYLLSGGGKLDVHGQDGLLRVIPLGQGALNAMFAIKKADAAEFAELSERSEKIFRSALSGNFAEVESALYDRDRMLGFFQEDIGKILEKHTKRMGEIEEISSSAVLPFDLEEANSSQVFVEFKGEKGSLFFDLVWRDEKIVGLGVDMRAPDLSIPFLPSSAEGNEYVGYHLDMARNFRLNFLVEGDGRIRGLVIPNEDGPIQALRSK